MRTRRDFQAESDCGVRESRSARVILPHGWRLRAEQSTERWLSGLIRSERRDRQGWGANSERGHRIFTALAGHFVFAGDSSCPALYSLP